MRTGADQDALIIAALAEDSPAAWEAFLRWASGPVWSACLHSSARRSAAEKLFAELTETLFEHRLDLPGRFAASRLGAAAAFLISEIDEYIGARIADGFRRGDHAAAEIFARYFHGEIKTWIQRATPPGERVRIEDRVQDVYAILLENDGRRLAAYPGGGSFRVFLRRLTLNASTDCQRREQGRFRLKAAIEKLSPLERKAYRLLYESRLSRNEAIARLGDPLAAAAVKVADALGDLGSVVAGARPKMIGIEDAGPSFQPPSPDRDPEALLLHVEEMALHAERENALLAALHDEREDVQRILQMRFLNGLKPAEIAERLGRDRKEIYRTLERALGRLKQILARPS
ncbi:sigma-70 family RNA polymerase sigma factor [Rhizobiales bacterium 3FA27D7]|jgi:RNA polymerase sigma factor (sigma-70 family)|uniref:RNA polymerase sigma factor n=1 Tax=Mesorhizobium sp. 2RAF21 TaxID=3232995 RepID=UPI0014857672